MTTNKTENKLENYRAAFSFIFFPKKSNLAAGLFKERPELRLKI